MLTFSFSEGRPDAVNEDIRIEPPEVDVPCVEETPE